MENLVRFFQTVRFVNTTSALKVLPWRKQIVKY